jgi:hypothetical protein
LYAVIYLEHFSHYKQLKSNKTKVIPTLLCGSEVSAFTNKLKKRRYKAAGMCFLKKKNWSILIRST